MGNGVSQDGRMFNLTGDDNFPKVNYALITCVTEPQIYRRKDTTNEVICAVECTAWYFIKLYDVPVGFVALPLPLIIWNCVLLYLWSPNGDMSWFCDCICFGYEVFFSDQIVLFTVFYVVCDILISKWSFSGQTDRVLLPLLMAYLSFLRATISWCSLWESITWDRIFNYRLYLSLGIPSILAAFTSFACLLLWRLASIRKLMQSKMQHAI